MTFHEEKVLVIFIKNLTTFTNETNEIKLRMITSKGHFIFFFFFKQMKDVTVNFLTNFINS